MLLFSLPHLGSSSSVLHGIEKGGQLGAYDDHVRAVLECHRNHFARNLGLGGVCGLIRLAGLAVSDLALRSARGTATNCKGKRMPTALVAALADDKSVGAAEQGCVLKGLVFLCAPHTGAPPVGVSNLGWTDFGVHTVGIWPQTGPPQAGPTLGPDPHGVDPKKVQELTPETF